MKTKEEENQEEGNLFNFDPEFDLDQMREDEYLEQDEFLNEFPVDSELASQQINEEGSDDEDEGDGGEEDESLFGGSGSQEEDQEEDDDEQSLKAFNERLGTDYQSFEEMKAALSGSDKKTEEEIEKAEYDKSSRIVSSLGEFIKQSDEGVTRGQLRAEYSQKGLNPDTEENKDEIEAKIESMKDSDLLESYAQNVRESIKGIIERNKSTVDRIDRKKEESKKQTEEKRRDSIQNYFSNVFKEKEFLGVTVTKEKVTETYENLIKGKLVNDLNNNPEKLAKVALFFAYEDEIQKLSKRPTHSDAINKVAKDFGLFQEKSQKARSIANASSTASRESVEELAKMMAQ